MKKFKTKIEGHDKEFDFECYENTEPIEIGDNYIIFFGGIADVQTCDTDNVKFEINKNDKVWDGRSLDFVSGFWKNCYKIKSTNFDLSKIF